MTDSLPPATGLVAGKYQVLGLIGRGGMGSVWEGRHTSLGTRVAIKFIDPEYVESKEACARFVTEARAAATIQSKHAIQIFDHGVTDDGRPYMVMELLLGEPLDKRIERLGTIPLRETARIIGHVCRALQRAHDAGIIHRDLKPENIFLVRTPDDDDEVAKVLDFGIAKIKAPPGEEGLSSSTKTGAVLGTPYYMSPEQARGLRNIDHRSDLWSLGVIAHKCVTGVLPFEGESVGDLLVKICTSPVPTPSVTVPGLPASFDAWFLRALEREPSQRYGRASELADALAFAAGLSTRGPASSQDAAVGPTTRAAIGATSASISGAALPAAGVTSAPFTTASVATAKTSRGVLFAVGAGALIVGSIGVATVVKLTSTPRTSPDVPAGGASAMAATSASAATSAAPSSAPSSTAPQASTAAPSASAGVALAGLASAKPTPAAPGAAPRTKPVSQTTAPSARPAAGKPSPNAADPGY
ncbi:MAG TPA: serine/threonine-protein kinase [Polyangiaceae bacterium]|nr:serine/threonine-protein kinase [Polyangiaceae bacterium]